MTRIFLVGFMGSGKTTVGRLLAERLGFGFVDLDEEICRRAGKAITEIFDREGEAAFRRLETDALKEVTHRDDIVVALGGGAFVSKQNRLLIEQHGISVWLDCPLAVILERLTGVTDRPLFRTPMQVEALYRRRLPSYALSDVRIDAARSQPGELVEEILSRLRDRLTGQSS